MAGLKELFTWILGRFTAGLSEGYGMITLASTIPTQRASSLDNDYSHPSSVKVAFFYISLYLSAIAQARINPVAWPLPPTNSTPDHPRQCAARCSFFIWWYFSIAIGITVAVALVSYIQENLGWGIGFGSLCVIMLSAFIVFLLGSPNYRLYAPTPGSQSPFTRLAHSIATLVRSSSFSFGSIRQHHPKDEDAMTKSEEACSMLRLLPIWMACLAYGVVFAQIMTFFSKQGLTLDRRLFGSLELPPAALQTFGPAAILLFVPIYDRVLVPALRCVTGNPSGLTPLQRVGTGMVVSLATVCVASLVEARRLQTAHEYGLVFFYREKVQGQSPIECFKDSIVIPFYKTGFP